MRVPCNAFQCLLFFDSFIPSVNFFIFSYAFISTHSLPFLTSHTRVHKHRKSEMERAGADREKRDAQTDEQI